MFSAPGVFEVTHTRFWAILCRMKHYKEGISSVKLAHSERRRETCWRWWINSGHDHWLGGCQCGPVLSFSSFRIRELKSWIPILMVSKQCVKWSKPSMGDFKNPRSRKGQETSEPIWTRPRLRWSKKLHKNQNCHITDFCFKWPPLWGLFWNA